MSVCDTARILPDFQGHSEMRLASHVLSSSSDRQRNLFPTSSDQLPSSLSTILTHREAFSEESDGRRRETHRAGRWTLPPSSPGRPPRFSKRLQPDPRKPTGRPPAHGPVNHYSARVGHQKVFPEWLQRSSRPFPPPPPLCFLLRGAKASGGSRREGAGDQAKLLPLHQHPSRPTRADLQPCPCPHLLPPGPAAGAPCSHTGHGSRSPPPPRRDRRRGQATLSAPRRAHAPSPVRAPPSRAPIGCAAPAGRGQQRVSCCDWPGGAGPARPATPPKPLLSRWRIKNKNDVSFRWSVEGRSPSGPARGAPAAEPQGRHERALRRRTSLGPCSRLGSAEPPAIGTAFRGGGGIEARPEGVIRPLIRAARGVLRYSTGGGGTCGASLRMRTGRGQHLREPHRPPSCHAEGNGGSWALWGMGQGTRWNITK